MFRELDLIVGYDECSLALRERAGARGKIHTENQLTSVCAGIQSLRSKRYL